MKIANQPLTGLGEFEAFDASESLDLLETLVGGSLDEIGQRGEVAVDGADADTGRACHLGKLYPRSATGEQFTSRHQDSLPVASGVGASLTWFC